MLQNQYPIGFGKGNGRIPGIVSQVGEFSQNQTLHDSYRSRKPLADAKARQRAQSRVRLPRPAILRIHRVAFRSKKNGEDIGLHRCSSLSTIPTPGYALRMDSAASMSAAHPRCNCPRLRAGSCRFLLDLPILHAGVFARLEVGTASSDQRAGGSD
jgi:hypothetical protein